MTCWKDSKSKREEKANMVDLLCRIVSTHQRGYCDSRFGCNVCMYRVLLQSFVAMVCTCAPMCRMYTVYMNVRTCILYHVYGSTTVFYQAVCKIL
jgi:hypothetical protein